MRFHLYLPQIRLSFEQLAQAAQLAESVGFEGVTGMDHLVPPFGESLPMYEAMITNAWLAGRTKTLKFNSLVLCDALRHPAVLARQAVSIDHASGGRFELGIGWGSHPYEYEMFDLKPDAPADRVRRLRETLTVLRALWSGETVDFEGEFFRLKGARQPPPPLGRIPIIVGGGGPKTMALVRDFADWWNLPTSDLDRIASPAFEEQRQRAGKARVSLLVVVGFVPEGGDRQAVEATALRRFEAMRPVIGSASELADRFGRLAPHGVERIHVWFSDFAKTDTLTAFGEKVVRPLLCVGA